MQVFCFYISLCTYSKFDAICIMHLHIHLTTSGIYHRPYAQRYVVFVPGESYFGYIVDAFLRAELCPHPPHTLPALVNSVSSSLSHISPRRRAHAAQIQRYRRAPYSFGLSERTLRQADPRFPRPGEHAFVSNHIHSRHCETARSS